MSAFGDNTKEQLIYDFLVDFQEDKSLTKIELVKIVLIVLACLMDDE